MYDKRFPDVGSIMICEGAEGWCAGGTWRTNAQPRLMFYEIGYDLNEMLMMVQQLNFTRV